MVREKEIFFKNILQIIDIFVVAIAFFLTFYLMGYIRSIYDLGEMAFAPTFDVYGAYFFFKNNFIIFLSAIFFWIIFLIFFGEVMWGAGDNCNIISFLSLSLL